MGLSTLLAGFIGEIKNAGVNRSDFRKISSQLADEDPFFTVKSRDLDRLLKRYEERCAASGLKDPEEEIFEYARTLAQNPRDASLDLVIFDGFFSFTEAQLQFIHAISRAAREVVVTLTLDHQAERRELFHYPLRMRDKLIQFGFREVFSKGPSRRFRSESLSQLERNLFAQSAGGVNKKRSFPHLKAAHDPSSSDTVPDLCLLEASSSAQEIEMIAREILRNVRSGGFHFSDHMLVLRSILPYRGMIEEIFGNFGIPCEIHERKRLSENTFISHLLQWMRVFQLNRPEEMEDAFGISDSVLCDLPRLWIFLKHRQTPEDRAILDEIQNMFLGLPSTCQWKPAMRELR